MNVLGVLFNFKLTWANHILKQINRANKALHAIKLIRKYKEILTLLTSNFYSILYYNSKVWHLPSLKIQIKQLLLSVSANAKTTRSIGIIYKHPHISKKTDTTKYIQTYSPVTQNIQQSNPKSQVDRSPLQTNI